MGKHTALFNAGVDALNKGDNIVGEQLIQSAYLGLQQTVVELRSGDWLMIALPDDNTQAAWLDAKRRYSDWVYTTQSLICDYTISSQQEEQFQRMLDAAQLHCLGFNMDQLIFVKQGSSAAKSVQVEMVAWLGI